VIVLYYLFWNHRPGGDATAAGRRHKVPEPKKNVKKNIVRISHVNRIKQMREMK
jgi:hypothetical protein